MSGLPATNAKDAPRLYDRDKVLSLLELLANGETVSKACTKVGISRSSFVRWTILDTPAGITELYLLAKRIGVEILAGECLDISDDDSRDYSTDEKGQVSTTNAPSRDRLKIDTRKWYVSKVAPKIYGDKVAVEHSGEVGAKIMKVVSQIPGPPAELLGEDIPEAEFVEYNPAETIEDLL